MIIKESEKLDLGLFEIEDNAKSWYNVWVNEIYPKLSKYDFDKYSLFTIVKFKIKCFDTIKSFEYSYKTNNIIWKTWRGDYNRYQLSKSALYAIGNEFGTEQYELAKGKYGKDSDEFKEFEKGYHHFWDSIEPAWKINL